MYVKTVHIRPSSGGWNHLYELQAEISHQDGQQAGPVSDGSGFKSTSLSAAYVEKKKKIVFVSFSAQHVEILSHDIVKDLIRNW